MANRIPSFTLSDQGIVADAELHWNLGIAPLVETAVRRGEGLPAMDSPLIVKTGKHTGRSANDKFIVRDAETEETAWCGKTNRGMTPAQCTALKAA